MGFVLANSSDSSLAGVPCSLPLRRALRYPDLQRCPVFSFREGLLFRSTTNKHALLCLLGSGDQALANTLERCWHPEKKAASCGWTKSCSTQPLFDRGNRLIPGSLRRCEMDSVHPRYSFLLGTSPKPVHSYTLGLGRDRI